MSYSVRPAIRDRVRIVLGLAGCSGSGKSLSAFLLATGIAGRDSKFCVIESDGDRALHYAPLPGQAPDFVSTFNFDIMTLEPPYRSLRYLESIQAADKMGYPVIVVDQLSYEHVGEGGHLEHQQEILDELVKRAQQRKDEKRAEWQIAEAMTPKSWIEPKHDRKKMVMGLRFVRAAIICCLRAEEKSLYTSEIAADGKKKLKIISPADRPIIERWEPLCGRGIPNEMMDYLLLTPDAPGVPKPIRLHIAHHNIFASDKMIDEKTGQRLADWAAGPRLSAPAQAQPPQPHPAASAPEAEPAYISVEELREIESAVEAKGIKARFSAKLFASHIKSPDLIPVSKVAAIRQWIEQQHSVRPH